MGILSFVGDKYVGLSSDVKPITSLRGSIFYELDTRTEWILSGVTWYPISGANVSSFLSGSYLLTGAGSVNVTFNSNLYTISGSSNVRKFTTGYIGNGTASNFLIHHGLNTTDLSVQINEMSGNKNAVITDWYTSGTNDLWLRFGFAPKTGWYSLTAMG